MVLDMDAAERVIADQIGAALGLGAHSAADAIVRLAATRVPHVVGAREARDPA
jgi:hypothetical protein